MLTVVFVVGGLIVSLTSTVLTRALQREQQLLRHVRGEPTADP